MINWAEKATFVARKTAGTTEKSPSTSCGSDVLCRCLGVTAEEVEMAVNVFNAESVQDLKQQTGAGGGCTACHRVLKQVLALRCQQAVADGCAP